MYLCISIFAFSVGSVISTGLWKKLVRSVINFPCVFYRLGAGDSLKFAAAGWLPHGINNVLEATSTNSGKRISDGTNVTFLNLRRVQQHGFVKHCQITTFTVVLISFVQHNFFYFFVLWSLSDVCKKHDVIFCIKWRTDGIVAHFSPAIPSVISTKGIIMSMNIFIVLILASGGIRSPLFSCISAADNGCCCSKTHWTM